MPAKTLLLIFWRYNQLTIFTEQYLSLRRRQIPSSTDRSFPISYRCFNKTLIYWSINLKCKWETKQNKHTNDRTNESNSHRCHFSNLDCNSILQNDFRRSDFIHEIISIRFSINRLALSLSLSLVCRGEKHRKFVAFNNALVTMCR